MGSLGRAFDYYIDAGDVDRAVDAAEYPVNKPLGTTTGTVDLVSRALALVPPDSYQAGRLLSTYGLTLYQETGDYEGAQEAFQRAMAIAQREQDAALEIRTLAGAAEAAWWCLRLPEVIDYGQRAVELIQHVDDPRSEVLSRHFLERALTSTGEGEAARLQATAMLAAAERLRDAGRLAQALARNLEMCFFRGEWEDAGRMGK